MSGSPSFGSRVISLLYFWLYRLKTILASMYHLYFLSPDKVTAFVKSYDIYAYDWADEKTLVAKMGRDYYKQVRDAVLDYYVVLNHLCAVGQVEKMYIPPTMDLSKTIIENQFLFEEMMHRDLNIRPGYHVLEVGCGRGRIVNHMASQVPGVSVTGINIDKDQLTNAESYAQATNTSQFTKFKYWDLNKCPLDFPNNSFDAIYQVQVISSYCKDKDTLFSELYRILKPGGRIAGLDWISLPNYDPYNVENTAIMQRVKPLIGAIGTYTSSQFVDAMTRAGFKVTKNTNASVGDLQAPLIKKAHSYFTTVERILSFLVSWHIVPQHFSVLFKRLTQDGDAFIEGDQLGLFTTSYYYVAEKPPLQ